MSVGSASSWRGVNAFIQHCILGWISKYQLPRWFIIIIIICCCCCCCFRSLEDQPESWFSLAIQCCLDKTAPALDPRLWFSLFMFMHWILDPHISGPCLLDFILAFFLFLDFSAWPFLKASRQRYQLFTQEQVSRWHLSAWKHDVASAVLSAESTLLVPKKVVSSFLKQYRKKEAQEKLSS